MRKSFVTAVVALASLPLLLICFPAGAASCPGAPAGVRPSGSFQIYSGATPEIYRICKGEPLRGGDCDIEIRNESNSVVAILEKQPMNSCACTDVEGKKVVVAAISSSSTSSPPAPACVGISTTVWYSNVRRD